jgi:predicted metal-dependent peptidase
MSHKEKPKCDCESESSGYAIIDPFAFGSLVDSHIESDITEEELVRKLSGAIAYAKAAGGTIPGDLEGELGRLVKPKISYTDVIRQVISKKREGHGRSDYSSPKIRPLFAGLFVPKKKFDNLKILAAYDCSFSMTENDETTVGISQLQVLDKRGEIYLLPWDTRPYYEDMVKIRSANIKNLKRSKIRGLGGTEVSSVFNTYEEKCGSVDVLIVITDGYLSDTELKNVRAPSKGTSVIWLIIGCNRSFKPPFGRLVYIEN